MDNQLIEDCKQNKNKARSLLYKTYSKWLLGVCMRYTKNKYEAEDVLHDTFVKIFTKINQFNDEGPFEAWMRRIAVNTAIEYIKNQAKENNFLDVTDPYSDVADDKEMPMPQMAPSVLMSLMQNLPTGYRLVFNMFVFEEMSHKEIASVLGVTENTSKTQLFKAKIFLKNEILKRVDNKVELKHSMSLIYE